MNNKAIVIDKQPGITPLQALERFKTEHHEYANVPLSYAGRLDPMAEGLLLVLVGEENKQRKNYLALSKTYQFQILVGVATDSYDILGIITHTSTNPVQLDAVQRHLQSLVGEISIPYPPYSSKPVHGKALFWYAKQKRLSEITIPNARTTITKISALSIQDVPVSQIRASMQSRIDIVVGDFRQKEIAKQWNEFFTLFQDKTMQVVNCTATVSSGTYIRGIVHHLGTILSIPMLAYTIKRTRIGQFTL